MENLTFLVILLEGFAGVSGIYYHKKNPANKSIKFFAYFLLFTYFVEIVGLIPVIIHWNESLHFLKDGFWYRNFWLYNPYLIISFVVYILYFRKNISNKKVKKTISISLVLYVIICIANLILSDVFLNSNSILTFIGGSFFLVAVIFYYYFEILLSPKILNIKREISFFISFPALLYFLCTIPVIIYYKYFTYKSPEFVELSSWVLVIMNIIMYGAYSIAFLCLANRKSRPKTVKNA